MEEHYYNAANTKLRDLGPRAALPGAGAGAVDAEDDRALQGPRDRARDPAADPLEAGRARGCARCRRRPPPSALLRRLVPASSDGPARLSGKPADASSATDELIVRCRARHALARSSTMIALRHGRRLPRCVAARRWPLPRCCCRPARAGIASRKLRRVIFGHQRQGHDRRATPPTTRSTAGARRTACSAARGNDLIRAGTGRDALAGGAEQRPALRRRGRRPDVRPGRRRPALGRDRPRHDVRRPGDDV